MIGWSIREQIPKYGNGKIKKRPMRKKENKKKNKKKKKEERTKHMNLMKEVRAYRKSKTMKATVEKSFDEEVSGE